MGKYLDILRRAEQPHTAYDKNDINDKRPTNACSECGSRNQLDTFGRLCRFCRTLDELERRCPTYVDAADWHQAIEDGRRFVTRWGERAEVVGWTPADLFGLHTPPEKPALSYRRLSRYDKTGLIWLLHGRPVIVLTEKAATILAPSGAHLSYQRNTKSAPSPLDLIGMRPTT
jgi:hypothetical protein